MKTESTVRDGRFSAAMPASQPPVLHIVGTLGAGGVQHLILGLAASPAGR